MDKIQGVTIDPRILEAVAKISKKRPKTVVDHIVKHGFITNEELKDTYGYNHPPRAIRDVREEGVPLELFKVEDKAGRKIGAYRFADPSQISQNKLGGRQTFSKTFKQTLFERDGCRCALCSTVYEDRYLTIDHRVPYEVAGEGASDERNPSDFMLLCGTCQRKKSWSCESCENWRARKKPEVCRSCYWAQPDSYQHLAEKAIRRVEITWTGNEVASFENLRDEAERRGLEVQALVKKKLGS